MHRAAQAWFSGGPSASEREKPAPSLLAEWNSYASSRSAGEYGDGSALGFDLEAAVRSANDRVSDTFSVVTKGVKDIPGSLQSATSNVPSGKSVMYFSLLLVTGIFFMFIAFTMFLPVMVLMPQKFALCFTIGCIFIIASFFALKGPRNQLAHMSSKERLPFTLGFISSMVGTIYASMVLHSYVLSGFFSMLQVLALSYYAISYFPGGSAGLKFLSSTIASSLLKCFGRMSAVSTALKNYLITYSGCQLNGHPFIKKHDLSSFHKHVGTSSSHHEHQGDKDLRISTQQRH